MSFGEIDNPFLNKVRQVKKGGSIGEFFGTPLEKAMKSVPGYRDSYEKDSSWWL